MTKQRAHCGITLLEVLLVMAILSILSVAAIGVFYGSVRSSELDIASHTIVSDLRFVRTKAMTGEEGRNWGIHFVNDVSDYYELFSSPSGYYDASLSVNATIYLPGSISFSAPPASLSVLFGRITGTLDATESVTVTSYANESKTITITPVGHIY